jgi:hypothetical protein
VDSRTTAAEMAGEPAVTAVIAAAAAPGANSASAAAAVEEAAERAATTSAGEVTATKRAADKSRLNNLIWMIGFLPESIF